jgi:POT family proton-dependent oligopeptide transporter
MGSYFVTTGLSQYLGGWVSSLASVNADTIDPVQTMSIYTTLFFWLGVVGIFCTLMALCVIPLMHKLSSEHQEKDVADQVAIMEGQYDS